MILDDIIEKRKIQLEKEKSNITFENIKEQALNKTEPTKGFYNALKTNSIAVISEVKKASPSKSVIREDFNPVEIAIEYEKAGANAISCLTEEFYFQGSSEYLKDIRNSVHIPILRKDFIIDEYQIYEARVIGADAILLIAAILDVDTMKHFKNIADSINLDCLFEVHNEEELQNVLQVNPSIVGINNRNLKTFEVSLDNTKKLIKTIPTNCISISESGIVNNADMILLKSYGVNAVLIGETLMRSDDISKTLADRRANI